MAKFMIQRIEWLINSCMSRGTGLDTVTCMSAWVVKCMSSISNMSSQHGTHARKARVHAHMHASTTLPRHMHSHAHTNSYRQTLTQRTHARASDTRGPGQVLQCRCASEFKARACACVRRGLGPIIRLI